MSGAKGEDIASDDQQQGQGQGQEAAETVAAAYEQTHVHGVYEAIAPHFSATRHKPWPFASSFLRAQPPGAVGLDVGCGNGKYMAVNPHVVLLGSDRSASLVALARRQFVHDGGQSAVAAAEGAVGDSAGAGARGGPEKGSGTDVLVADGLALPFRDEAVDFVICIAVIHHLSTRERRVDAIRHLLRCVRGKQGGGASTAGQKHDADVDAGAGADAGKDDDDRRGANRGGSGSGQVLVFVWALEQGTSRRGWDEGGEQDLLVPWVMKEQLQQSQKNKKQKQASRNGNEDKSGEPPPDHQQQPSHTDRTFQRYYHLYRKGELEEDVIAAGGEVLSAGYERDNWWVIAGRK